MYLTALGLSCSGIFQLQCLCVCVSVWVRSHMHSGVDLLIEACRTQFPDQGCILSPLHWEHRIVATGA